jgi:signal peptidase I
MQLIWILSTVVAIISVGTIAFLRFCCSITTVCGDSMIPSLADGDRLLTLNLLPRLWLQRGQMVVGISNALNPPLAVEQAFSDWLNSSDEMLALDFMPSEAELLEPIELHSPMEPEEAKFIKRITGLPGDTISVPLSSLHELMQAALKDQCNAEGNLVWTIPDRHCFVQGDSPVCVDSLSTGPIPIAALTGIALLKLPRR